MGDERKRFSASAEFELIEEIAKGGMGRILRVRDRALGRDIALKILLTDDVDDVVRRRFIQEAKITGQLEHPNIVAVHNIGVDENKQFFTMKLVQGESLGDILHQMRKGILRVRQRYSQMRLLNIFVQICMAIHYAHTKGVIHRDLKPHNIMIGEFGETLVMDWGLAKFIGDDDELQPAADVIYIDDEESIFSTQSGMIFGTPAYMSPEQASGKLDQIDKFSDIYSLGAILYEMLAFYPPFKAKFTKENLERIINQPVTPPSKRAQANRIPVALEQICLKALSKEKSGRFASARELADEIEAFLQGTQERERRTREAARKTQHGERLLTRYNELREHIRFLDQRLGEARRTTSPSAPVKDKRKQWSLEDLRQRMIRYSAQTFSLAEQRYAQALGEEPDYAPARRSLAHMYWTRYRDAIDAHDMVKAITYANLVFRMDDDFFAEKMFDRCQLSVTAKPPNGRISIYMMIETDRQLRPQNIVASGQSPLENVSLPRGNYLVRVEQRGYTSVNFPIVLNEAEDLLLPVTLYTKRDVGHGFCHIPGGYTHIGGDPLFPERARQRVFIGDYFIAQYPVTFEEYLAFVVDLASDDGEAVAPHLPRTATGELLIAPSKDRGFMLRNDLLGEDARRVPVFGVSWRSAVAYCGWRSAREEVTYRLPTSAEWEKAARGVDGRIFPWGNTFDPTFCDMRFSRSGRNAPAPVDQHHADMSPYGVMTMAGGVREWCADWFDESARLKNLRGGAWNGPEAFCRATACDGARLDRPDESFGFRLCRGPELARAFRLPTYVEEAVAMELPLYAREPDTTLSKKSRELFEFDMFSRYLEELKEEIFTDQPRPAAREKATTPAAKQVTNTRREKEHSSNELIRHLLDQQLANTKSGVPDEERFSKLSNWGDEDEKELKQTKQSRPGSEIYLRYKDTEVDGPKEKEPEKQ